MNLPPHMRLNPERLSMAYFTVELTRVTERFDEERALKMLARWYSDCTPYPERGWDSETMHDMISAAYSVMIRSEETIGRSPIDLKPSTPDEHYAFGCQMIIAWIQDMETWEKHAAARTA